MSDLQEKAGASMIDLQENAVVCIMRWGEEAGPLIWRERGRTGRGTIDGRNVDRCKYYIELHIVELKIWKYSFTKVRHNVISIIISCYFI